ncbi:MAG: hypothetical protein WAV11_02980 [Minisyncoccia bacterium]
MEPKRWYLFSKNCSEIAGCKFYLTCLKPQISIRLDIRSGYKEKYKTPTEAIPAAKVEAIELVSDVEGRKIPSEFIRKKIIGQPIIPEPIAIT